jgi:hypothetical protein
MRGISLAVGIATLFHVHVLMFAQASPAPLTGTVTDARGAPLLDAVVKLADAITGAEFTARANETGAFSFPSLSAGSYSVTVSAMGFRIKKMENITIEPTTPVSLGSIGLEPEIDAVQLVLDASRPGRPFNGIGGNFRLQHPKTDREVVEYNLKNLNVAWGRICMRWSDWQPEEDMDPIAAARAGNLREPVRQTMEMARRLAQANIPVIASIWFPPKWAIKTGGPRVERQRNDPLNHDVIGKIYKSIGDYFVYMKEVYGVEPVLFSFNESEKGVNVYQSPQEHADLIKTLGAYLVSRGLSTKMLLGDTSMASDHWFYQPALDDPDTHKYIGAIGYHSWGGNTNENLALWAEAGRKLNVPVMLTEGGLDGAAHNHPAVFSDPRFQLREIDLYVRALAYSQPITVMHWQLTTDYSILTGLGIRGDNGVLSPTQRFWNLKQLGVTPAGSFALPITADRASVSCAAYGNIAGQVYTVHLVNNGGARPATITGLPDSVRQMRVYITDRERGMQQQDATVTVANGTATLRLSEASLTTLISEP